MKLPRGVDVHRCDDLRRKALGVRRRTLEYTS